MVSPVVKKVFIQTVLNQDKDFRVIFLYSLIRDERIQLLLISLKVKCTINPR